MVLSSEQIECLQADVKKIRNVCILAHVDHGKTTLADRLICSNGIISEKSAGRIRFLDNREDEQTRFITMKASSISLFFHFIPPFPLNIAEGKIKEKKHTYLINIVDSPGHVDFSSEINTAIRLTDGSLILIDAVEGVCSQTKSVLRQAWKERSKPFLVINKIDRLFLDLHMSASEAYVKLQNIVVQMDACLHELICEEAMEEKQNDGCEETQDNLSTRNLFFDDAMDAEMEFSPVKGNVVFCSGLHGWCADLENFAIQLCKKMDITTTKGLSNLMKCLWGDFYFSKKTKLVTKKATSQCKKQMFVQFVLEPIWKVYEVCVEKFDIVEVSKMIKSLGLCGKINVNLLTAGAQAAETILSKWLPLAERVLRMIVTAIPSPDKCAESRLRIFCPQMFNFNKKELLNLRRSLQCSLVHGKSDKNFPSTSLAVCTTQIQAPGSGGKIGEECNGKRVFKMNCETFQEDRKESMNTAEDACMKNFKDLRLNHSELEKENVENIELLNEEIHAIVYVSKFLCADLINMRLTGDKLQGTECMNNFVAFARVFSGVVKAGTKLYVCGTAHSLQSEITHEENEFINVMLVRAVYAFMGRDLQPLNQLRSGSIGAIEFASSKKIKKKEILENQKSETHEYQTYQEEQICEREAHNFLSVMEQNVQDIIHWFLDRRSSYSTHNTDNDVFNKSRKCKNIFSKTSSIVSSVDRCVTLSTHPLCPPFFHPCAKTFSSSIVRVSVEPCHIKDLQNFLQGLALLYKADPSVDIEILENGEYLMGCCGEVHLERCINDLINLYARIPINVSEPLVAIRETLVCNNSSNTFSSFIYETSNCFSSILSAISNKVPFPPWSPPTPLRRNDEGSSSYFGNENHVRNDKNNNIILSEKTVNILNQNGVAYAITPNQKLLITVRAFPMPEHVLLWIDANSEEVECVTQKNLPCRTFSNAYINKKKQIDYCGACAKNKNNENEKEKNITLSECLDNISKQLILTWNKCKNNNNIENDDKICLPLQAPLYVPYCTNSLNVSSTLHCNLWGLSVAKGSRNILLCSHNVFRKTTINSLYNQMELNDNNNITNSNHSHVCNRKNEKEGVTGLFNYNSFYDDINHLTENDRKFIEDWTFKDSYQFQTKKNFYNDEENSFESIIPSLIYGFELASISGPIAEEPVRGIVFLIESISYKTEKALIKNESNYENCANKSECLTNDILTELSTLNTQNDNDDEYNFKIEVDDKKIKGSETDCEKNNSNFSTPYGPLSGQVMSTMKEVCRKSLLQRGKIRIFEALLRLELQCEQEVLGKTYAVLAKRRAQIISEELREGTSLFCIVSYLPAIEAFGIAEQLRSSTSGNVSMYMEMSHWKILDEDPFPEASMTQEELEDFGESGVTGKCARKIINFIRKRKGLPTEEKIVSAAEKQRTLSKNK